MTDMLEKSFRKALRILTIAGVAYFAALAGLYAFQEQMLFFPKPESPTAGNQYDEFEVSFTVDDNTLDGWYIPGASNQTLVYYGGNGEEQSVSLKTITKIGDFNYLLVNYRGYGESTGSPSEKALKSDAVKVLDLASQRFGIDIREVVLMGRSLGTGVAMHVAANRPIKALILVSPFDSVAAVARTHYPFFPIAPLLRHPFRSIDYVEDTRMPTLILKSATDEIVPHKHTDNLIANWRGPLLTYTLPGTTHNRIVSDEYFRRIRQFLGEVTTGQLSLNQQR